MAPQDTGPAGEESPLLQYTSLPSDIVPARSLTRRVIAVCALFLFLMNFSEFIMEPAKQQIMEDNICRQYYPNHALGMPRVQDSRCKATDVQKTLAMVRSWSTFGEMLVSLLVQVPYGVIADKYGRRPVLFLALFGCVLQQTWTMIVLLCPDRFSIWSLLYSYIAFFIGGGVQMGLAICWTILADAVPATERASVYSQLWALTLLLAVAIKPLSALLLSLGPSIAMWIAYIILLIGGLSSVFVPETLKIRQAAGREPLTQSQEPASLPAKKSFVRQAWFTVQNDISHVWRFIFASKSIMVLIVAYGISFTIKLAFSIDLLQYMTRRFNWEWSTATYISTVGDLTSAVLLLVILPVASALLAKRPGYNPLTRDLFLARVSIVITVIGSLLTAVATVPWLFITALIINSLGSGFSILCRALLNSIVAPHTIATLNTTMSTLDTLMGLVSAPMAGWLLSRGIELGGAWMGLPFILTTVCGVAVMVASLLFRIPAGVSETRNLRVGFSRCSSLSAS